MNATEKQYATSDWHVSRAENGSWLVCESRVADLNSGRTGGSLTAIHPRVAIGDACLVCGLDLSEPANAEDAGGNACSRCRALLGMEEGDTLVAGRRVDPPPDGVGS